MFLQTFPKRRQININPEQEIKKLMFSRNITFEEAKKIIETKQKSVLDYK